jgi:asparagine synthase (glutamine-hydrolysing)
MCGIVGIVDHAGLDCDAVERRMDRALERLSPRGPDGEGCAFDRICVLGHRRLAIVDLSQAGAQPMKRGALTITYNGMIYNFRALRRELETKGARFITESDTEVLLAGWQAWGPALLPRLTGMFAFAIWDADSQSLTLARDRFGQKPLLYRYAGQRLAFASDLRALQRIEGERGTIDPAALRLYFALRYLPEPWSILEGVRKLPAGHLARFDASGLTVERWFDLASTRGPRFHDEAAAAVELRARVDQAIADRLVADVPVGAFLSGGIDSAIVAAGMVRAADTVRTFTVGFEGAADYYEERPAAKRVAEHLGTEHTEIAVGADEARNVLDAVFDGLDEPFADSSAIPTFLVSRETRRHVTVALSGDGADEVFGGYRKYQGELHARSYRAIPGWLRAGVLEPAIRTLPESKGHPVLERTRRLKRLAAQGGKEPVGRHAGWARSLEETELDMLLGPAAGTTTLDGLIRELREAAHEDDPINAMLATDIGLVLPGDMLVKVDRMSMAQGLEVRCPFLDHRVVACAANMPGGFKLKRGSGKHILRQAFRDRLPAEVFARPKKGFEVPIAEWLSGPLRDLTRRAIDPVLLQCEGLIRPELPAQWFDQLERGRRDTSWQLWSLVAFRAWQDRQAQIG